MFRTSIVVWFVLFALALNVVAFVMRFIEKYRPVRHCSMSPERTVSVTQSSRLWISNHQQNRPTHQQASSAPSEALLGIHDQKTLK